MDSELKKKLFLAAALFLGLLYLAYDNVYTPRSEEIDQLRARLEVLETKNRVARTLIESRGRAEVEQQLALYRDQLESVEGLIPSSEELPDLLDAISAEAQRTGVELTLIQPVGATAEAFYTRRTYDLRVRGTYHEIGWFLTEIGSLPRIITPLGVNLTINSAPADGGPPQLDARFSIETYVLPSGTPTADT
jgi:type IV pilus assembly protein PilO